MVVVVLVRRRRCHYRRRSRRHRRRPPPPYRRRRHRRCQPRRHPPTPRQFHSCIAISFEMWPGFESCACENARRFFPQVALAHELVPR